MIHIKKCFIKNETGNYIEIPIKELEKRITNDITYKNKKFIYISKNLLEVSKSYYTSYHQERERNRYSKNILKKLNVISIDAMQKNDDDFEFEKEIIEDSSINIIEELTRKSELQKLNKALLSLSAEDYKIIKSLFYDETTIRECAKKLGIPKSTLYERKEKILKYLKNFIEN